MDNTLLIIWLIVAVISVTYFFVSNANTEPEEDEDEQEKFPAVTIVVSETDPCPSVMLLAGQRILVDESPLLPLIDCTSRECTCTYRHYVDRRGGSRRVDEKSVIKRFHKGIEKRVRQRGRRAEDLMEDTFEQTQDQVFDTHDDTYYDYVDRTGLFKAMAAKEADESAADSSDQDSSDQAPSDQAPSDQASVPTLTPASSDEAFITGSSDQKKSGQSRS